MALSLLDILERISAGQYLTSAEVGETDPGVLSQVTGVLNGGANAISAKLAELRAAATGAAPTTVFGGAVTTAPVAGVSNFAVPAATTAALEGDRKSVV